MNIGFDAKRAFENFSGLGNYSRDVIKHLLMYFPQHSYSLFTPKPVNNPRTSFVDEYTQAKVIYPKSALNKNLRSFWRSFNLSNALQENSVDIYHGLSNELPARRSSKIPFVVTIHDLIFRRYPEQYKTIDRKIYNTKFSAAAQNTDRVIAISEQTKRDIMDFYGTPESKIQVLYQSCHESFRIEHSPEQQEATLKKYKLPQSFLLHVGTIIPRKNLSLIIDALIQLKSDIPLVVVGGKTKHYLEVVSKINSSDLDPNRIIFLDNVSIEELSHMYARAEAFLYPSIFEGFGIPIIESLYAKTPVISSKGGCFKEAGGEHSIYVDSSDAEELSHAISKVLSDSALQSEMASKGFEFVQKFNPEPLSKELMELYQSLV